MAAIVTSPFDGGIASGTYGPGCTWNGLSILNSPRFRDLAIKESYYQCTQHDSKRYDFDGRILMGGGGLQSTQPLLSSEKAAFFVPLRLRRPSSPYRLPRVIVNAFTNLVFGEGRFPQFRVSGDLATQDFVNALSHATRLPMKMIRVRNLGGSVGTACMSWAYVDGYPRIDVHNAKYIYIHSWEDREELIVRHATEAYLSPKIEWVPEKKKFDNVYYWYRRDWTTKEDIVFKPLKFEQGVDPSPFWEPDLDRSTTHNDGVCHFHWIQNLPTDEPDGASDYEGLFENFDALDLILSVILRGATLNLDPTLVLRMDADLVNRIGVKKGSDNALTVGKEGDAHYLELAGSSIEAGVKLFNEARARLLEVANCVIPDPDKVGAQGMSSVAQKMMFTPMIGKGDQLREQYGTAMERMLEDMCVVARMASQKTVIVYDPETMQPVEAQPTINLPPRIEQEPVMDENENPTGDFEQNEVERDPGEGEEVDCEWGPWFPPTPDDIQKLVTTVTTAAGQGTSVLSQQTASELVSQAFNRDPADEWGKMQKAQADAQSKQAQMFDGDVGGKVEHTEKTATGGEVTATLEHTPKSQQPPPPQIPGAGGKFGGPPGAGGAGGKGGGMQGGDPDFTAGFGDEESSAGDETFEKK